MLSSTLDPKPPLHRNPACSSTVSTLSTSSTFLFRFWRSSPENSATYIFTGLVCALLYYERVKAAGFEEAMSTSWRQSDFRFGHSQQRLKQIQRYDLVLIFSWLGALVLWGRGQLPSDPFALCPNFFYTFRGYCNDYTSSQFRRS